MGRKGDERSWGVLGLVYWGRRVMIGERSLPLVAEVRTEVVERLDISD